MKKYFLSAFAAFALAASVSAGAQVVVRIGPPRPVYERRPVAPGAGYVWQPGYHRYEGNNYVWTPGRYERAPYERAQWVPGHWNRRHGGYVWVEGHWRH